jgi:hypothetical protein
VDAKGLLRSNPNHPAFQHPVASLRVIGCCLVAVALVYVAALRALMRDRRWGWWFLLVVSVLGAAGLARVGSLAEALEEVPALVLLIVLAAPETRRNIFTGSPDLAVDAADAADG